MKYLLISILFFSSCETKKENTGKDRNEIFNIYLKNQFNLEIKEKKHFYLLLPNTSCFGCNQRTSIAFNELLNCCAKNVTIIISKQKEGLALDNSESSSVYYDVRGIMDRLQLNIINPSIVKTENGKIKNIINIPTNNLDKILNKSISEIKSL